MSGRDDGSSTGGRSGGGGGGRTMHGDVLCVLGTQRVGDGSAHILVLVIVRALEVTVIAAVLVLQLPSAAAHHPRHVFATNAGVMVMLVGGRVGGVGWRGRR